MIAENLSGLKLYYNNPQESFHIDLKDLGFVYRHGYGTKSWSLYHGAHLLTESDSLKELLSDIKKTFNIFDRNNGYDKPLQLDGFCEAVLRELNTKFSNYGSLSEALNKGISLDSEHIIRYDENYASIGIQSDGKVIFVDQFGGWLAGVNGGDTVDSYDISELSGAGYSLPNLCDVVDKMVSIIHQSENTWFAVSDNRAN